MVLIIAFVVIVSILVLANHDWEVTNAYRDLRDLTEDADFSVSYFECADYLKDNRDATALDVIKHYRDLKQLEYTEFIESKLLDPTL